MGRQKEGLKIYLIAPRRAPEASRDEDGVYFTSAIVAADNVKDARGIHPSGDDDVEWDEDGDSWGEQEDDDMWVPPYDVVVERCGLADHHVDRGVLLAAINDDLEERE